MIQELDLFVRLRDTFLAHRRSEFTRMMLRVSANVA